MDISQIVIIVRLWVDFSTFKGAESAFQGFYNPYDALWGSGKLDSLFVHLPGTTQF